MISNSKIKAVVPLVAMLVVAVALVLVLKRSAARRSEPSRPLRSPAAASRSDSIASSGSQSSAAALTASSLDMQSCAACHAEIVEAYRRSGMSHSWRPVDAGGMPESLLQNAARGSHDVDDRVTNYRYTVDVNDDGVRQTETHPDFVTHRLQRRAAYAVGSGKKATAFVAEQNGYLTQMPAAWFAQDQSWRMNPGFELQNHRFDRPITPACVACHATTATHEPPTRNRFELPIAAGIACQRCHGATDQHVAFWTVAGGGEGDAPDLPAAEDARRAASLAHTVELTHQQRNDLCLQCHLQGDVVVDRSGRDPLQFSPGDRLLDHRHDLLIADETPLGIASHGARMLQSRCSIESGGRLTCTLCHDPHRPASDFSTSDYDAKCATCHTPQSCSRPQSQPARDQMSGCIACHMPRRSSQEGIHLVLTDHRLQARPEPSSEKRDASVALRPNSERIELVSAWPDETPSATIQGAALVQLHESMGPQPVALHRARVVLAEALANDPRDLEARYWLGAAQLGLGQGEEAVELLADVVRRDPGRDAARFRLAAAYELLGDFPRATSEYQQLVEIAPSWLDPYPRLAQLYLARQNPRFAIATLEHQLSYREDAPAYAQLALARRLLGGSHEQAMQLIDKALALDPRLPRTYLHRAALSLLIGDNRGARDDFEFVLRLEPGNEEARRALRAMAGR